MNIIDIITVGIIAITGAFSYKGFTDSVFFDRYKFNVGAILRVKQWDRMLSSALLHGDWMHLIFNMYSFYFFARYVMIFNIPFFFLVYIGSILGGNLLALWMHRKNSYYSAIGASGGVSGVIFAAIILRADIILKIFPFPFDIPGWIFGIIYLAYSVYGMKNQLGNIGHEAHLGGAVIGMMFSLIFIAVFPGHPYILFNWNYLLYMSIPLAVLGYLAYKNK